MQEKKFIQKATLKLKPLKKFKKPFIIIISLIISIVIIVIAFISPITKYLIEKYDVKYTGRQITLGWVYVNPFTGYIHFSNMKVMESKSDSVFFEAEGMSANIRLTGLWSNKYEIEELILNKPKGRIIQKNDSFNFDDMIQMFQPKKTTKKQSPPVKFSILSFQIIDGIFYYNEKITPILYFIKKVNITSTGYRWDSDTIGASFSMLPGIGSGDLNGNMNLNIQNNNYKFAVIAHKFDLKFLEQYLKDISNYGNFSANIDANIQGTGNFNDQENMTTRGHLSINDFHFGKTKENDYASFDQLTFDINLMSPKKHIYLYDSIILRKPYFKYEQYDYLDNLELMFGKGGEKLVAANSANASYNLVIEIAKYIKVISKNFLNSDYKINRLAILNADIKYNDYSISEKFSIDLNPLFITGDSINKKNKRVYLRFATGILPYGNINAVISINPKDSSDFDLNYHFQKIPISMFNPYTITYTSYSMNRGTMELNGNWHVQNSIIQSTNHLIFVDPRSSHRVKNKDTKWVPLPIILAIVREKGNVIDYEIPITGNLNNPKFNYKDAIKDALKNLYINASSIPYHFTIKSTESEIDKLMSIHWDFGSCELLYNQKVFVKQMVSFLSSHPEARITVNPISYTAKEHEHILLYEAKKKYYLTKNNKNETGFTNSDKRKVQKMSAKEADFTQYLNAITKNMMLNTVQEKCEILVGNSFVVNKLNQLNGSRNAAFIQQFKDAGLEKQVSFTMVQNNIPFNGFSYFVINYKGGKPEVLLDDYRRMSKLNTENPRKEYFIFRKNKERSE